MMIRAAVPTDVRELCRFGEDVVRAHYAPLIGAEAADAQVSSWWTATYLNRAVSAGTVLVAVDDEQIVGVGQRGRYGSDHVIYKLYVHPGHRRRGVGVSLIDALVSQLPPDAERVLVEHVAANERAGAFYEREGFSVDRVEPSPSGDPRLAQVWRIRHLT